MTVDDILAHHVVPFEINDLKLLGIFSYFLHRAPTIDSRSSSPIPSCGLEVAWTSFIDKLNIDNKSYQVYAPNNNIKIKNLITYKLSGSDSVDRRAKRFVCCMANKDLSDNMTCLLRHIRNSIAHSNVYLLNQSNRKYLIFDDFNDNGNQTARILLSQTDLRNLQKILKE